MTKFEELSSKRIYTVGELIQVLQNLPEETKLSTRDADVGGYDVSTQDYVVVNLDEDFLTIGHHEYEIYEAYKKKEITFDQYELLTNNNRE